MDEVHSEEMSARPGRRVQMGKEGERVTNGAFTAVGPSHGVVMVKVEP